MILSSAFEFFDVLLFLQLNAKFTCSVEKLLLYEHIIHFCNKNSCRTFSLDAYVYFDMDKCTSARHSDAYM